MWHVPQGEWWSFALLPGEVSGEVLHYWLVRWVVKCCIIAWWGEWWSVALLPGEVSGEVLYYCLVRWVVKCCIIAWWSEWWSVALLPGKVSGEVLHYSSLWQELTKLWQQRGMHPTHHRCIVFVHIWNISVNQCPGLGMLGSRLISVPTEVLNLICLWISSNCLAHHINCIFYISE